MYSIIPTGARFNPTMAVYRLKDKPHGKARKLPWRAVVPREGQKPLKKQFADRNEATIWEAERKKEERLRDVPEFQRTQELKNLRQHTVRDLVFDHIKRHPDMNTNEVLSLNQFARENIEKHFEVHPAIERGFPKQGSMVGLVGCYV